MMTELDNRRSTKKQEVSDQKRQLRHTCRQVRDELGETVRRQASASICAWIEAWPVFQGSSVILTYLPITGEVDLTQLLERHPEKQWVIPRIIPGEKHRMAFHPYESGRLIHHPFGMDEPTPDLPTVPPSEVQLALVPGLAFDVQGKRLGYGGGYFDRFLSDFHGISVGVIYQVLLLARLPYMEHDVAVSWIITEKGFYQPGE